jgi:hypothetical protein
VRLHRVYHLLGGVYQPAPPGSDGSMPSRTLDGYDWLQQDIYLRLRECASGLLAPTPEEAREQEAHARAEAEAARVREQRRVQAADDEIARLKVEIARLRAELPSA